MADTRAMHLLPDTVHLADQVRAAPAGDGETVAEALVFLLAHREQLRRFESAEHLVLAADGFETLNPRDSPPAPKTITALAARLAGVRLQLADALWSLELFVGPDLLNEHLFHVLLRRGVSDPVLTLLDDLRQYDADRPGFALFPLHSFGVLGAGLLQPGQPGGRLLRAGHAYYADPRAGLAIAPQTNNLGSTLAFLDGAAADLGVAKPPSSDSVTDWHRTGTDWLERNPLLMVRVATQYAVKSETERLVLMRVRAITGLLAMATALQDPPEHSLAVGLSSSKTNNRETLDLWHYAVFVDMPGEPDFLVGDLVPIPGRRAEVVELSDLGIQLDRELFVGRQAILDEVRRAVDRVYRSVVANLVQPRDDARVRTYRRMFESLTFFRRSFAGPRRSWSQVVSLATAFELLLSDGGDRGIKRLLSRRVRLLLGDHADVRAHRAACAAVYRARCELVHAGEQVDVDMLAAQRAFVHAFCELAERVDRLDPASSEPLRVLTGDERPQR